MTVTAFALHAAGLALIPLLTGRGLNPTPAALALGLLGAGQLLGRLGYAPLSTRTTPTTRTRIVLAAAAAGLLTLAVIPGPPAALIAAAVLVGATRGAATLLQATLVADHWGTTRYATLAGLFAAPITVAAALAPVGRDRPGRTLRRQLSRPVHRAGRPGRGSRLRARHRRGHPTRTRPRNPDRLPAGIDDPDYSLTEVNALPHC